MASTPTEYLSEIRDRLGDLPERLADVLSQRAPGKEQGGPGTLPASIPGGGKETAADKLAGTLGGPFELIRKFGAWRDKLNEGIDELFAKEKPKSVPTAAPATASQRMIAGMSSVGGQAPPIAQVPQATPPVNPMAAMMGGQVPQVTPPQTVATPPPLPSVPGTPPPLPTVPAATPPPASPMTMPMPVSPPSIGSPFPSAGSSQAGASQGAGTTALNAAAEKMSKAAEAITRAAASMEGASEGGDPDNRLGSPLSHAPRQAATAVAAPASAPMGRSAVPGMFRLPQEFK